MNPFSLRKIVTAVAFLLLGRIAFAGDVTMKMTTTDGATKVDFQNSAAAEVASIDSTGKLTVSSNVVTGGFVSLPEMAAAGTAATNRARLYAKDIGGDTYLAYVDSSGTERIIKPQLNVPIADAETAATNLGTTYKDVHWSVDASKLSRTIVDFDGYHEARIVFPVDNNEADTIQCQVYNETDAIEIVSGISDATGNPQVVSSAWSAINLVGEKTVQARCREGTGATSDPDIGSVRLQLR